MTNKTCPKCNKKSEDLIVCSSCGLNFEEHEVSKQEKLLEIHTLLSESKYQEAKEIAEKLPLQFPDNKTDFILLLSNINRDISIVGKSDLAHEAYQKGDYAQASFLLRNIKAFNPILNENVISLRRKAERHLHNQETFNSAVAAFNEKKYATAKRSFKQIHGLENQDEIDGYLEKAEQAIHAILDEPIEFVRNRQFPVAENKFKELQAEFPDLKEDIEGYLTFLAKRVEIKNSIIDAARKAKLEKRLLESKVLYSFLVTQFPEFAPLAQPHLDEIGSQAITGLAEIEDTGGIDCAALGLDGESVGYAGSLFQAEDLNSLTAVACSQPCPPDVLCPPVEIDVEGVDDFIF